MKFIYQCVMTAFAVCVLSMHVSAQCTAPVGSNVIKGSVFNGQYNDGTSSDPDVICVGSTVFYELQPPVGHSNASFGTTWGVTSLIFETATGTPAEDTTLASPTPTSNARITFKPVSGLADSVLILSVTVFDAFTNCDTTIVRYVYISPLPTADFTSSAMNLCVGDTFDFTNNSTAGVDTISAYLWTFGDGDSSHVKDPKHAYASAGSYKVWLRVTNSNGCTDTISTMVNVSKNPIANFSLSDNNICLGESISFTNASTDTVSAVYRYNFGNGNFSTGGDQVFTYSAAGTYTVSLTVVNSSGCTSVATSTVTVNARPSVSFSATNVCVGSATSFINSTTSDTTVTNVIWHFGDGDTSTQNNPSHTYAAAGTYSAKLIATNANGCTDSFTTNVTVYELPSASFSSDNLVCANSPVSFTNTSNTVNDQNASYVWNFGDGNTASTTNATHTYATAGMYTVTLTVNRGNCSDVATSTVVVNETPSANFTYNANGLTLTFMPADTTQSQYTWAFGNGDSSSSKVPTYTYAAAGTYSVTLVVGNITGCSSSVTTAINVTSVSVNEPGNNSAVIKAYPNPFNQSVTISYELQKTAQVNISLYDLNGRKVYFKDNGKLQAGKHQLTINEQLPSGTYFIRLIADDNIAIEKLVKID